MTFLGSKNDCCFNCFNETEIIDFIKSSDETGDCDYCDSTDVPVRNVQEVGDFIMEGFLREYEDAANQVGYCSEDEGYLLSTNTIDEILIGTEGIFGDALEDPDELIRDLVSLDGTAYVRKDPYGPPSGEPDEITDWDEFCDLVKNKKPFTSFQVTDERAYDPSHPNTSFKNLINQLNNYGLIYDLEPGLSIYRGRLAPEAGTFVHSDLTSPPVEKTKNNRMSPVGISIFYGSLEKETCVHEVRPSVGEIVAVAEFVILRSLKILDLTELPDSPDPISIFNENYGFSYETYFKPFFCHFAHDIAKPIRPGATDIEYRPTQAFTEFLRFNKFEDYRPYPLEGQNSPRAFQVDGIMFQSSLKIGGRNLVLFRGNDISREGDKSDPDAWLL
ncbi:MAG: RES domain-containing protein, partial [Nitrospinae bacterium]|nr:RES domain-containing protein [Nitrospinota bacterium]